MTMNHLPFLRNWILRLHFGQMGLFFLIVTGGIVSSVRSSTPDSVATVYRYRQSKGATVDTEIRSVTRSSNETVITYENVPDIHSRAVCDSSLRNSSWHYENRKTDYDVNAGRFGDTIEVTGRKGKKTFHKSFGIDILPWYQALEFSLRPFLESGARECEFWMIRPTDMTPFKMMVRREDTATIQVDGRPEKAVHIILSPSGLSGRFWKASYWYRSSDYTFLKSVLPQIIPGSAPLIIELIGKQRRQ